MIFGRSVELPSGRLAFRAVEGAETPVLLLHGNSSSSGAYGRLIPLLAEAGLPVIAPDFPGHGASDDAREPEKTYSFPGYAAAISGLLDAVGIERAIVIGWSLGGHVAMELLATDPRVTAALVTGAPPIRPSLEALQSAFLPTPVMGLAGKEQFSVADARSYAAAMLDGEEHVTPHADETALRTDGRARRLMIENGVAGQGVDETALLRSGPARLAIVQGDGDVFLSMDYLKALPADHLWRGAIQWLDGLGHAPHWTAPERFAPLALAFIEEMRAA